MKKLFTQLSIACLFLSAVACTSESADPAKTTEATAPTADFSFTGGDMPAPAPIVFENKSTNATDYLWEFGDDSNSLDKNPTHTYAAAGTYSVTLTVTGKGGSTTKTKTIQITAPAKPTTAKITGVTLTELSWTDEGDDPWDPSSGPDVRFWIVDSETYKDQISSQIYNDLKPSQLPFAWSNMTPKTITDLTKDYEISLSEIDGDYGNDIARAVFTLADYTTGPNAYPKTITIKCPSDNIYYPKNMATFVLNLTWQ